MSRKVFLGKASDLNYRVQIRDESVIPQEIDYSGSATIYVEEKEDCSFIMCYHIGGNQEVRMLKSDENVAEAIRVTALKYGKMLAKDQGIEFEDRTTTNDLEKAVAE